MKGIYLGNATTEFLFFEKKFLLASHILANEVSFSTEFLLYEKKFTALPPILFSA